MAYTQTPGATGSLASGGEYDNVDTAGSVSYSNLSAGSAAASALSAAAALASQTAAAASATSASNSATSATASASTATTQASNASTSATNAATSASSASASAATATTQASNASASASAASTSATNAASSASAASTSASNASSSASAASSSATSASNSATTATTQATSATNSATAAGTSATNAANSATSANTSATNASASASAASTSASAASTSETNAATSASTATTQAGIATTQATNASTSASSASASASTATTQASNASTSASNAATSATNAANSATLAASYTPSQTGNSGKFLTTNGTATSWASIVGALSYQGSWNASTNSPTLTSSVGSNGYYYVVSVSGSTNLDGITDWVIGDWVIFNGATWQKIDQTNLVTSVAGRTGAITLANTDISGLGTMSTQAASSVAITGGSITGITDLAVTDGGTGASTAQGAINTLAGAVTSGSYLRGNGTNVVMNTIQTADVPTLNQNTTGSAATLTTGRTVGITGDITYTSPSFDGSANVTAASTLATVNTNVGSFTNANVTVNAKGLVTAASNGTSAVTSVTGTSPVVSSGGTTPAISLATDYGDTLNPYASKTANYILAAPNGASGAPTFRAIVAADIPTLNQNTTGTAANITGSSNSTLTTLSSLSLPYGQLSGTVPTWNQNTTGTAANVTGIVAIANGGTNGTTTPTAGAVAYGTGTAYSFTSAGTSGQVLTSDGSSIPTWTTIAASDPAGTAVAMAIALG